MNTDNKSHDIVRAFAQCHGIADLALSEAGTAGLRLQLHRPRLIEDLRRFEGQGATPKRTTVQQMKRRLATGGVQ